MRKNIKFKLLVYYLLAISMVLAIFSILIVYVFYKQNIKTIDAQMLVISQEIEHSLDQRYKNDFKKGFDLELDFHIQNLYIEIYETQENRFFKKIDNHNEVIKIPLSNIPISQYRIFQSVLNDKDLHGVIYHSHMKENVYIVVYTTIGDKIYDSLKQLMYSLFIINPLIFVIFMLVGYYMIRNSFKSVQKVIDEVHEIEVNDLDKRINRFDSDDEIGQLVDTFNELLARVEEGFERIKRFSNDVSHELKTPLTVLRGEIELGLRKPREVNEYKEILHTVLEETKSLQELIDGLLFLSNKNQEEIQETFFDLLLDEIVLDVITEQTQNAKAKNIEFNIRGLNNAMIQGNELLIKIMIGNILNNAIKYSHTNSRIDIALYDDGLSIKDYGIGIKQDEINKIFDRFYRADLARQRGDGFGLGLSMVANIAKIHNIKLDVQSEYGKFTQVMIIF